MTALALKADGKARSGGDDGGSSLHVKLGEHDVLIRREQNVVVAIFKAPAAAA